MKKNTAIVGYTLYSIIWSNIRRFQYLNGVSDPQLADILKVTTRTLYSYDKDPSAITLDRLQSFIDNTGIEVSELVSK